MVYQWKYFTHKVKAQDVGECFERLENRHGTLTPELIVKEAKKPRSILHSLFEWDDAKAAAEHRLTQARYYLRMLVVVTEIEDDEPIITNAYVSLDNNKIYDNITNIMVDDTKRARLLAKALAELVAFQKKYGELEALAEIFKEVTKVIADKET